MDCYGSGDIPSALLVVRIRRFISLLDRPQSFGESNYLYCRDHKNSYPEQYCRWIHDIKCHRVS